MVENDTSGHLNQVDPIFLESSTALLYLSLYLKMAHVSLYNYWFPFGKTLIEEIASEEVAASVTIVVFTYT